MLDDIKWKAKHKLNKIFKVERCSLLSASEYQSSSINQEFTDILCDLSCGKAKNSVYEYEAEKREEHITPNHPHDSPVSLTTTTHLHITTFLFLFVNLAHSLRETQPENVGTNLRRE